MEYDDDNASAAETTTEQSSLTLNVFVPPREYIVTWTENGNFYLPIIHPQIYIETTRNETNHPCVLYWFHKKNVSVVGFVNDKLNDGMESCVYRKIWFILHTHTSVLDETCVSPKGHTNYLTEDFARSTLLTVSLSVVIMLLSKKRHEPIYEHQFIFILRYKTII